MSFDAPGVQFAFDEGLDAVLTTTARRDRLDAQIVKMAAEPLWRRWSAGWVACAG